MKRRNTVEIKVAKTDREFVGIKIKNNNAIVTFPIGYRITEKVINTNEKEEIEQLFYDVKLLMTNIEQCQDALYDTGYQQFSFSSSIYILEDFLKNGLYNEKGSQNKKNTQGKIQWRKTIQSKIPAYSAGNYIYLDTYNYNICSRENKITQIHKYCLSIITKILGWLYNCNNIYEEVENYYSKEEMIYELLNELNMINEDRKKKLLEQMLFFLRGTQTTFFGKEEFEIGTYYYDKVWENVLRKQAYLLYQKKQSFPTTYYFMEKKIINSKLLPDIIINTGKTIVIMDAKYYKIGSFPESADICKQLFYGQYIRNENKKYKIFNTFLLPQKFINEETQEKFWKLGYANAEHLSKKDRILTYYLDTKSVMASNKTIKRLLENIVLA